MKTWLQSILPLRNDEQQVVTNGYPDLRVDGVHGCAIESLDVQMLFDPFEKHLNLPPFAVQLCYGYRLKGKVVCQKSVYFSISKIFIHNEPKRVGVFPDCIKTCKSDCLIRNESGLRINFSAVKNFILHIFFRPGHEPGMLKVKVLMQRIKLDISFVHKIISVWFDRDIVQNLGVMNGTFCETDKCWDGASEVHKSMHFECPFTVMKLGPWAKLKAKLYGAAVKGINHLVKVNSKLFSFVEAFGLLHQNLSKVLIYMPILLLVRFCKGGFRHNFKPGSIKVLGTEVKGRLNISQTTSVCELGKAHHQKLVPATVLDGMPVALIAANTLAEFVIGIKKHKLCEDCFAFIHCLQEEASVPFCKHRSSNRKIIYAL